MAGPQTSLMLGDALMNIQEVNLEGWWFFSKSLSLCLSLQPEQALSVYEKALKKNPRDSLLASKVGQSLIKTHQYTKVSPHIIRLSTLGRFHCILLEVFISRSMCIMQAISYYEAALKSEGQQFLRRDLATLYLRLNHFDRAERTIQTALSQGEGEKKGAMTFIERCSSS